MIDEAEVRRIARLARLEHAADADDPLIDDETAARLAADMRQILAYVEQLSELDVSEVPPTSHGVELVSKMRPDRIAEDRIDPERLLDAAPSRAEHAVSVPKIVE